MERTAAVDRRVGQRRCPQWPDPYSADRRGAAAVRADGAGRPARTTGGAAGTSNTGRNAHAHRAGGRTHHHAPGTAALTVAVARTATDTRTTPWSTIVSLYDALLVAQPSPVIMLNRAIAIGFRDGYRAGLVELEALDPTSSLAGYYLLPAARADFLRRLQHFLGVLRHLDLHDEARRAYEIAARLAPADGPEQRLLQRRLTELTAPRQM